MRKALREFLVASLDGYGDALTWVDFATRGRAQMMIGEDIMPQRRGRPPIADPLSFGKGGTQTASKRPLARSALFHFMLRAQPPVIHKLRAGKREWRRKERAISLTSRRSWKQ